MKKMVKYPDIRIAKCKKCGGDSFRFSWRVESEAHGWELALNHDGFGYQFKDSVVECANCGVKSEYESEDFLEIVSVKP